MPREGTGAQAKVKDIVVMSSGDKILLMNVMIYLDHFQNKIYMLVNLAMV